MADDASFHVPRWVARLEQACLVLLAFILLTVGLAEALSGMLTPNMPAAFSALLGLGVMGLGTAVCWRTLQPKTYHLLRKGELSLLDFIIG